MANNPYFSVIIPALNEEKYLPKILKALSLQTFRGFEVILIDGSSSDKTVDVFEKYIPLIPKAHCLIVKKQNVGYQRNYGAKKACGKYLVFLDADVDVEETFLEELHLKAIKRKFLFATTWIVPDSNKTADKIMVLLGNLGQELARGIGKPFAGGYNTIIRREIFLRLKGFREDLLINEDHEFAMKAEKANIPLTILKEPHVEFSLRRWRSEGKLAVYRKYALTTLHTFLKGPITRDLFEYKMGGQAHRKRKRKKLDLYKIDTYLKTIKKLEKRLIKLLNT